MSHTIRNKNYLLEQRMITFYSHDSRLILSALQATVMRPQ